MKWMEHITIGAFFDRQVSEMPYQKALITPEGDFTFKELKEVSDFLARGLINLGIRKGDKVAVWTNNTPEWVFLFLSLSKVGAVMVPLSFNARARDLHYTLEKADVKFLFLMNSFNGTDFLEILHDAIPDLQVLSSGEVHSKELPYLRRIITVGKEHRQGLLNGYDVLERARRVNESDYIRCREAVSSSDTCIIKFTCGLTGYPRGAMLTHFGLINNAQPIVKKLNLGPSDILCLPLPFYYIFGFWVGLMATFTSHTPVVITPKYNALEILKNIEQKHCTALYGVPTTFSDLLNHPSFSQFDLSSLRTGVMSGDYCSPELVKKTIREIPIPELTVAYGITEVGLLTQTGWNESPEKATHTVGQALDGMELKVISPGNGETLPAGEKGEICVRSPVLMKGYYNMPRETFEIMDKDGWFHTGDLGVRDEEGYYQITGRKRNIIIRGGENIYPLEVERLLLTYPDISDVRVVGVPSHRLGEEVYAFVTTNNGTLGNHQTLRDFFRNKISRNLIPRWVKILEELPGEKGRNVDRNELRSLAIQDLGLQEDRIFEIIYEN